MLKVTAVKPIVDSTKVGLGRGGGEEGMGRGGEREWRGWEGERRGEGGVREREENEREWRGGSVAFRTAIALMCLVPHASVAAHTLTP